MPKNDYRQAAKAGMDQATSAAAKKDPLFAEKIRAAVPKILIAASGWRMKGEEITTAMVRMGIEVKKQAMGPIMSHMERRLGLIKQDGTYPREGGHGAKDGKWWKLTPEGAALCRGA